MVLTSKWGRIQPGIQIWHVQVTWRYMAVREPPKDVLKMASGLISPSGLAGHRRQLCNVSDSSLSRPESSWREYDKPGGDWTKIRVMFTKQTMSNLTERFCTGQQWHGTNYYTAGGPSFGLKMWIYSIHLRRYLIALFRTANCDVMNHDSIFITFNGLSRYAK